jgi:protein-tyrosine phosphatase
MIDIHTHLLPFVDDGVRDYDESIEIISDMASQGVKHIFLTPHYYRLRNYVSTYDENLTIFNELKEKVKDAGLSVHLYLGNEIKYTSDSLRDISNQLVKPLMNHTYLIEFSVDESVYDISEAIHNMTAKKYRPIIAHIERYQKLDQIDDVRVIKKLGALIQVNVSSLLGLRGSKTKRWIKKLIKNSLVDFIATDTHMLRKDLMLQGYRYVEKKFSKDMAEKLFNNQIILEKA